MSALSRKEEIENLKIEDIDADTLVSMALEELDPVMLHRYIILLRNIMHRREIKRFLSLGS